MKRVVLIALVLAATVRSVAADDAIQACDAPKLTCSNGLCRLEVSFPAAETCRVRIDDRFVAAQKASRITEKTAFRIRIRRANLLRFAVAVDTKETVIESYVYLEKLWKQVLGLGTLSKAEMLKRASPGEQSAEELFVDAINAWRSALSAAGDNAATITGKYKTLTLTETEASDLKTLADSANSEHALKQLDELRESARTAIKRVEHFAVYDATLGTHQEILDKLDSLVVLTGQIVNGLDKKITFGDAGRVVAVTISAQDRSTGGEAPQAVNVDFLVHSTLPVTFHAGYTVRGLKEENFEAVATSLASAGGADLFSKVQDSKANGTFTAFMSYRPCDVSRAARCLHFTIGTDFKDVGERLYGGVSWPLGRAFFTVGVVSGETREGQGPVSDALGAAGEVTGARELFTAIATKRKWGGFVGMSFAPF